MGSTPGLKCEKGVFLAVGPYWLVRCQYNVTEMCALLICDIVHQFASTLKVAISAHYYKAIQKPKALAQTRTPHKLMSRLILEINKLELRREWQKNCRCEVKQYATNQLTVTFWNSGCLTLGPVFLRTWDWAYQFWQYLACLLLFWWSLSE